MGLTIVSVLVITFICYYYCEKYLTKIFVSCEPFRDEYMITCKTNAGKKIKYVGSCTVWHTYPNGKRAGTITESWLFDRLTAYKWKEGEK